MTDYKKSQGEYMVSPCSISTGDKYYRCDIRLELSKSQRRTAILNRKLIMLKANIKYILKLIFRK